MLILFLSAARVQASPEIRKDTVTQISGQASSWYGSYGNLYLNGLSYAQDQLVTYGGWQYAAYYDAQRHVAVARRRLPAGPWQVLSLTDYRQTVDDTHNNISMGISADGRIHLSFDHHGDPLHYRMSAAELANRPDEFDWTAERFLPVKSDLGSGAVQMVTYPRFMLSDSGAFLFAFRVGSSGDGDNHLYRYRDDGTWERLGQFVEGGGENAYFHGMEFGGERLHVTWCWRATSDGNTNHDLLYAFSDDYGKTWKNNGGQTLSTTGSDPIHLNDAGYRVFTIAQGTRLINQEGMAVDAQGRVHVISRENVGSVNRQMHYFRDTDGKWNRISTGIATLIWDNRSKIAWDTSGNVYAVLPNLVLAGASVDSGYQDWTVLSDADNGRYVHCEPLIDRMALRGTPNRLYVFAQRGTANSGSSQLEALAYTLDPNGAPTVARRPMRERDSQVPALFRQPGGLRWERNGFAPGKELTLTLFGADGRTWFRQTLPGDVRTLILPSPETSATAMRLESGNRSWSISLALP